MTQCCWCYYSSSLSSPLFLALDEMCISDAALDLFLNASITHAAAASDVSDTRSAAFEMFDLRLKCEKLYLDVIIKAEK